MYTNKTKSVVILKKFSVFMVALPMFLSLVVAQVPEVGAIEPSAEGGLLFLKNVARLDMDKYTVMGTSITGNLSLGMQSISYTLVSGENRLSVLQFGHKGYIFFKISSGRDAPLFVGTESNVVEEAKNILERYEANYNVSYVQEMRSSLDMFASLGNSLINVTRVMGDITMEVSVTVYEGPVRIEEITWSRAVNGVYNRHDIVALRFKNGVLERFCDSWNRYEIGSASVNVNEEQAISIAKEEAAKTWWTSGNVTVSNVKVVDESILTELYFAPREDKLYPFWVIRMGLDKVYPSGVTSLTVVIRADTGQPEGTSANSGYGDVSLQQSTPQDMLLPIIAAVSAISLTTVILALLVARRRKRTQENQ